MEIVEQNLVVVGSVVSAVILQTIQATIIYFKMKSKLDAIARTCVTISDVERWTRALDDANKDLKVPDITEFVLRRRRLEQEEQS